ncbi:arsenate-mycothiol transferase ArsC [Halobaculum roseum]|jgi:protein-tyrosine-phosphatase|uniref:Low molecular weight phosphatase family protein n=2 Tax=Halobacteriales TaxID=2235 RepID=A0ABD5MIL2_9EURY|nr:low molecular weight phosphatase family protein [Halobaculum roseum]QZY04797.1 low molecular weight phosphatase family protein [Halobaculum roseum]
MGEPLMVSHTDTLGPLRLGFVCVQNAGRSQIAAALAETQVQVQMRSDIEIVSGGTDPAVAIHPTVIEVMSEKGYDLSDRSPTKITRESLEACDFIVLMGCALSIEDLPPGVVVRDWGFVDPVDSDRESVWAISTEIEQQVIELFDELPTQAERRANYVTHE